jgi:hypothetical protein
MTAPVFSILADQEWFEHQVDLSNRISRPATDKDRAAWPAEYRAFKVAQLPPLAVPETSKGKRSANAENGPPEQTKTKRRGKHG